MSKREKKYAKGRRIESMDELLVAIKKGGFIFMNHKPIHIAFIISMPFRTVLMFLETRKEGRGFFYAVDARPFNLLHRIARGFMVQAKARL